MLDYFKFFDVFDPIWTSEFFKEIGLKGQRPEMVTHLYQNLHRYIKLGSSYGPLMRPFNGLGQGDSTSLLDALALVSVQSKMLDSVLPDLRKSACLDDRNLRGSIEDVTTALKLITRFDEFAGHIINPTKTTAMTSNNKLKKTLRRY